MKEKKDLRLQKSVAYLRKYLQDGTKTAVILGSAWSDFADELTLIHRIPYEKIPGFPRPTVAFQKGELLFAQVERTPVLVFSGRFHYYEGFAMWECAYPMFLCRLLGIETVVITNAAGGLHPAYRVGDLVMVCDHVKLCADSPCRGSVNPLLGERFFELQSVYDPDLQRLAQAAAQSADLPLQKGVYGYMAGPQFETAAEVRALQNLGVDVVGMSTVPEIIAGAHCRQKVLCFSLVSNLGAGIEGAIPNQAEVLDAATFVKTRYAVFLKDVLCRLAKKE